MDQPPGLDKLDRADALLGDATDAVLSATDTVARDLLKLMGRQLPGFVLTNGALSPTTQNLRKLQQMRPRALALVGEKSAYGDALTGLMRALGQSNALTTSYIEDQISALPASVQQVGRNLAAFTAGQLLQAGPDAVNDVLNKVVVPGIAAGATPESLLETIQTQVVDQQGLRRRLETVVVDATEQSSRNFLQTASADLGLSHYFYKGTLIDTSRRFCAARVGKYFTQEEVEAWAALKWSGKNPATNRMTIFTLLGGYRCRHRLVPVSKAVYEAKTGSPSPDPVPTPTPDPAPAPPPALKRRARKVAAASPEPPLTYPAGKTQPDFFLQKYGLTLPNKFWNALHEGVDLVEIPSGISNYGFETRRLELSRMWDIYRRTPQMMRSTLCHELGHAYHQQSGLIERIVLGGREQIQIAPRVQQWYGRCQQLLAGLTDEEMSPWLNTFWETVMSIHAGMPDYAFEEVAKMHTSACDLVSALTDGRRGFGHTPEYLAQPHRGMMEFFAHSSDTYFNGNPLIKKYLPAIYDELTAFWQDELSR